MEISEWHEKNWYERYKPLKYGEYKPRRAAREYPEEVPQFSDHHIRPSMLDWRPVNIGEWDRGMDRLARSGITFGAFGAGDLFLDTENMTVSVILDGRQEVISTLGGISDGN